MRRVLAVTWFALRAAYDELFLLTIAGLLWFILVLVIPFALFWLINKFVAIPWVTIVAVLASLIPAPPATAALYYVAHHLANRRVVRFGDLLEGFRTYLVPSFKIAGLLLVSGAVLVGDVVFYLNTQSTLFAILGLLGLWALAFWLGIQVYLFPLLISQEDKSLKLILKNASLLTLAYPFFSLGIWIVVVLATVVSALAVILLGTLWMPFIALLNSRALISSLDQVERFREQQREIEREEE
jgi:hypothetical protein